jgi:hypothetical protein
MWSASGGSWDALMKSVTMEVGKQAEETTQWMRASIAAANELSESRYANDNSYINKNEYFATKNNKMIGTYFTFYNVMIFVPKKLT